MRKFIISDIHGNGNLYYSVMSYLENISIDEPITLYINGDLIDRGLESGEILLDVINRINSKAKQFKIVYLAGNHELMMHHVFEKRRRGAYVSCFNDWYLNGGNITDDNLMNLIGDKNKILKVADFIANLDLYYKFSEKINDKNIVLVHASTPSKVKDECDIKIKDMTLLNDYYVWARADDSLFPFKCRIGNNAYFSIVGHTPNNKRFGYFYNSKENYLNIDGGSAYYVPGHFEYDHYPLVEIKDDYLKILTFNNNNEIIYGNYFNGSKSIPFTDEELNYERMYLSKFFKPKKLVRLEDNIIDYSDGS